MNRFTSNCVCMSVLLALAGCDAGSVRPNGTSAAGEPLTSQPLGSDGGLTLDPGVSLPTDVPDLTSPPPVAEPLPPQPAAAQAALK